MYCNIDVGGLKGHNLQHMHVYGHGTTVSGLKGQIYRHAVAFLRERVERANIQLHAVAQSCKYYSRKDCFVTTCAIIHQLQLFFYFCMRCKQLCMCSCGLASSLYPTQIV